jgi:hypothetical protein
MAYFESPKKEKSPIQKTIVNLAANTWTRASFSIPDNFKVTSIIMQYYLGAGRTLYIDDLILNDELPSMDSWIKRDLWESSLYPTASWTPLFRDDSVCPTLFC